MRTYRWLRLLFTLMFLLGSMPLTAGTAKALSACSPHVFLPFVPVNMVALAALVEDTVDAEAPTTTAALEVYADFNGDGCGDLAVGAPDEDVGSVPDAGWVNVIYGSQEGLTSVGNQGWGQNGGIDDAGEPLGDLSGTAEAGDSFGTALIAADFNGDGYADLAIGIPGESVGTIEGAGSIAVLYGTRDGLTAAGSQGWGQSGGFDSSGEPLGDLNGSDEAGDGFGAALAAGDFNGDGYADVAVGIPGESVEDVGAAGAVTIIYGSKNGLVSEGNQGWSQNGGIDATGESLGDLNGAAQAGDRFGEALIAGDVNGDGYADLVIGIPGEDVASATDAGAVALLYGSKSGLVAEGNQGWSQNGGFDNAGEPLGDLNGSAEANDHFGETVAAGDFNGDGYADVAVGVPGESVGAALNAGSIAVIYGSANGLTAAGNQGWGEYGGFDSDGELLGDLYGAAEAGDEFGASIAAGDFNRDGYTDVVIGIPGQSLGSATHAGAIAAIYGSPSGLVAPGNQGWSQNGGFDADGTALGDLTSAAEENDRFGAFVTAGDFNGDGYLDVGVGIPGEDVGSVSDAGSVATLYGASQGLGAEGNQGWSQDGGFNADGESLGDLNDSAEADDRFGAALNLPTRQ